MRETQLESANSTDRPVRQPANIPPVASDFEIELPGTLPSRTSKSPYKFFFVKDSQEAHTRNRSMLTLVQLCLPLSEALFHKIAVWYFIRVSIRFYLY